MTSPAAHPHLSRPTTSHRRPSGLHAIRASLRVGADERADLRPQSPAERRAIVGLVVLTILIVAAGAVLGLAGIGLL